jgi:hypothetical protein
VIRFVTCDEDVYDYVKGRNTNKAPDGKNASDWYAFFDL